MTQTIRSDTRHAFTFARGPRPVPELPHEPPPEVPSLPGLVPGVPPEYEPEPPETPGGPRPELPEPEER